MRILIVGINFWPELTGTGKYTGEMAEYLAARGHQVTVVTAPPYFPQWIIQTGYRTWKYKTENWNNVKIIRCPLFVPHRVTGFTRIIHLISFAITSWPVVLREKRKHPDIIFAVAPTLFSAPAAAYSARRDRSRNWLHIQDFELDAALNLGLIRHSPWVEKFARAWETAIYRKFGILSSISYAMLGKLKEKGVPEEKIHFLPNWVDTSVIHPIDGVNSYREQLHFSPADRIVLYSGSIGKKQGMEMLIETGKILENEHHIHFIICGDGPGKSDLVKSAAGLPNIHFLPVQPGEALNELLNMADMHVLPQRSGAADLVMPSKLLGMLASGKAVIAACAPGSALHDVVDQVGVVVPPEDPAALKAAIMRLTGDDCLREKLGSHGRSYVEEHFDKNLVLSEWEKTLISSLYHKHN
jgi:colanic acid biosynthesis glycosyl transferase WcaI